jgi:hypothetical protein
VGRLRQADGVGLFTPRNRYGVSLSTSVSQLVYKICPGHLRIVAQRVSGGLVGGLVMGVMVGGLVMGVVVGGFVSVVGGWGSGGWGVSCWVNQLCS